LFGRAYLSVDLFFILSGFVIANAYHEWLMGRGSPAQFLRARVIRLYPLYLMAAISSALIWLVRIDRHGAQVGTIAQWKASLVPSLFMLPTPPGWSFRPDVAFPFNALAWSLFYELAVKILYAFVALRLGWRTIALLLVTGAGIACTGAALNNSFGLGWMWDTFAFGFGRALFGFFAGFAVWRAGKRWPAPVLPGWLLAALFLVSVIPAQFDWTYDAAAALLLFPLLVWLGASATTPRWLADAGIELGLVSYAVYILQGPILRFVTILWEVAFKSDIAQAGRLGVGIYSIAVVLISWFVTERIDAPLRAWLARRFVPGRSVLAEQAVP
jgi:peptidoglycan/LPS O-acetylase OafA/YrhL